ncbi:MAG: endopeptidase La [Ruminococcus sp.]|nr:endopeptidase La [Ruminococcus sp.]
MSEKIMPILAIVNPVPSENVSMHFEVGDPKMSRAMEEAIAGDKNVFICYQRQYDKKRGQSQLASVGVVCQIKQLIRHKNNTVHVMLEGKARGKIENIVRKEPYLIAEISRLPKVTLCADTMELEAVIASVKQYFDKYTRVISVGPELMYEVEETENPSQLFDLVAQNIHIKKEEKQLLLETDDLLEKLTILIAVLAHETDLAQLTSALQEKVRTTISNENRRHFLREQLRTIKQELGETESEELEDGEYFEAINALPIDDVYKKKLRKDAGRLESLPPNSSEYALLEAYIETVTELPWDKRSEESRDITGAEAILNADHFGLVKVKERILELLSVRALKPDVKGQIICLSGPPGIGKTSVAKSVAKALGREYQRVSLGGVRDEADIRGHRKTYIGSMPGRIINAVKLSGVKNPLILLDEIDKLGRDGKGDPSSALLEVLDSEQNIAFRDHYVEVPFDLSEVLFITTANNTANIEKPLLDRMEVIELGSYTANEKFHIAYDHLIPKQFSKNGIAKKSLRITDEALRTIIECYTKEAGVRTLERNIAKICRKAAKMFVSENKKHITVNERNLEKFLGIKKYTESDLPKKNEIGVVNGLAWTAVGGVILPIEVIVTDGTGKIELTGSLGDVMKESAKIAVTYARLAAVRYGYLPDFYGTKDIHIHAPEGATPKDGPSAGVTMTTALISALSGVPVRRDVAMTGEITLRGRVLPIGGLREKLAAAYKAGITRAVIPKANKADLEEVDPEIRASLDFTFAETISDVLGVALESEGVIKSINKVPIYHNKVVEIRT